MTLEFLRYFIEVCNCGSIQSASKKLFVSSQGLGQAIQRMEKSLDVKLLQRTPTGVRPTEFGLQFYEKACIVDREMRELEKMAEEYNASRKLEVTIGVLGNNTKFISGISACASAFCEKEGKCSIRVNAAPFDSSESLFEALRSGSADMAMLFHWREYEDLKYFPCVRYSPLVLLTPANSELARRQSVTWKQLEDLKFVVAGVSDPFADMLEHICGERSVKLNNCFYGTENTFIANLIDNHDTSIILREGYHTSILQLCSNAAVLPIEPEVRVTYSLILRKRREFDPEIMRFVDHLVSNYPLLMGMG